MIERAHYSRSPLSLDIIRNDTKYLTGGKLKPVGIWYAIDDSWREWCESEDWGLDLIEDGYKYHLTLDEFRIKKVKTEEVIQFTKEYCYNILGEDTLSQELGFIDWPRLAVEGFYGIEINPYNKGELWDRHFFATWFSAWDVPGGCIWNPKAIIKLEEAK